MKYTTQGSGTFKSKATGNSDYAPQSANERFRFKIKDPSPQKQKGAKIAGAPAKGGRSGKSLVKLLGMLIAQKRLKSNKGRQFNGSAGA